MHKAVGYFMQHAHTPICGTRAQPKHRVEVTAPCKHHIHTHTHDVHHLILTQHSFVEQFQRTWFLMWTRETGLAHLRLIPRFL